MLPEAAGRGQHFQVRGHSFFTLRTDPSRKITFLSFFLAVNWLTSGFVYATSSLSWVMPRLQNIRIKNQTSERASISCKV